VCELAIGPCAVVRCGEGRIQWAARNATFPYLPRGRVPGPEAAAIERAAWGSVPRSPRVVPARTWLGRDAPADHTIIEHAMTLPGTSDVLSMLRIEH
jgi:hypothetical protein